MQAEDYETCSLFVVLLFLDGCTQDIEVCFKGNDSARWEIKMICEKNCLIPAELFGRNSDQAEEDE